MTAMNLNITRILWKRCLRKFVGHKNHPFRLKVFSIKRAMTSIGSGILGAFFVVQFTNLVECQSPHSNRVERDYKTESSLTELLVEIRQALDQIDQSLLQIDSNDGKYVAVVHRDFIRIQIISKSTKDVLEFIDCEYHWMTSDISKAEFCRITSNETNGVKVDIDSADAFDMIYRCCYRISVDIASKNCKIARKKS